MCLRECVRACVCVLEISQTQEHHRFAIAVPTGFFFLYVTSPTVPSFC